MSNLSRAQQQWLWITLCSLIFIAVAAYKLINSGLPLAAEKIAANLPTDLYQVVDTHTLESLDEYDFTPSQLSENRQQALTELFNELLVYTTENDKSYQLIFRAWQSQPNALALANGTIVITDSLVLLAESDAQLSSVLLHEIAHIEHNHVMEGVVSASLLTIGLTSLFGDISLLGDLILQGSIFGLNQAHSREAEQEADLFAAKIMKQREGIEPMVELLTLLSEQEDRENNHFTWLSSHPDLDERIAYIQQSNP